MNRKVTIPLAVLFLLGVLLVGAKLRYPGRASAKLPAASCDAALWDHVYEKDRLELLDPCTAVEGRVVSVHHNADGDMHIALDPEDRPTI